MASGIYVPGASFLSRNGSHVEVPTIRNASEYLTCNCMIGVGTCFVGARPECKGNAKKDRFCRMHCSFFHGGCLVPHVIRYGTDEYAARILAIVAEQEIQ
jgi:hypothetical protein